MPPTDWGNDVADRLIFALCLVIAAHAIGEWLA
mgnify:CR=1 FL=1